MGMARESIRWFLFSLASALVGFVGLAFFSRALGARIVGIYFLFYSLLTFFNLLSNMGLQPATIKRISEGRYQDEFFTASLILRLIPFSLLSVVILLVRGPLDSYMGADLSLYLIGVLGLFQFTDLLRETLHGERKVARGGFVDFVQQFARVGAQVLFVVLGAGLLGLIYGLGIGVLAALALGLLLVDARPRLPRWDHFKSLFGFSRYSFGSALGGYVYEWAPVAIVGLFLAQRDVGIYGVAQSVAAVSLLASHGVANAIFPRVSALSARGGEREVAEIFRKGMAYSSLVVLPVFAGALVLSKEVLEVVFGADFGAGSFVLVLLLLSQVFRAWQMISVRVLEGINRPDIVFRVNLLTTGGNLLGCFILIRAFGLAGAAAAAVLTISVSLWLNTRVLKRLIPLAAPYREIAQELFAAAVMALSVLGLKALIPAKSLPTLLSLVTAGGLLYIGILLLISPEIKSKAISLIKERI